MDGYISFILRHRPGVLVLCALLTGLAAWSATRAELSTNLGEQFLGDRPEHLRYQELSRDFASDEVIVVGLEGADVLDPAVRGKLRLVSERLEDMREIDRVESALTAPHIRLVGDELWIGRYLEETPRIRPGAGGEGARDSGAIKDMLEDAFVRGAFLSDDGGSAVLAVVLRHDPGRRGELIPPIVAQVKELVVAAGFASESVHLGGYVPALAETLTQLNENVKTLFPVVAVLLLLIVWLLFRRLWPAALALGLSLLGVLWTLGVMIAWQRSVHVMFSLFPPVILIVSFSDVVHLSSAYFQELAAGKSKDQAIRDMGREVGRACLFTSVTTFIGFMSLCLVPDPSTRYVGMGLAFGVAVSLVLAVTLVPILFSLVHAPRPLRLGTTARAQALLDRGLETTRVFATGRPRLVVGFFVLLLLFAALGLPRTEMDFDLAGRFPEDSAVHADDVWFQSALGSSSTLDVYVHAAAPQGFWDPKTLDAVQSFQGAVRGLPEVRDAASFVDVIARLHAEIAPEEAAKASLPQDRASIAQYAVLLETEGGSALESLIDMDYQRMRIRLRLVPGGARALAAAGVTIKALARDTLPGHVDAEVTGLVFLLGSFFDQVFYAQGRGLLASFFVIMLMMTIAVGSVRVGVLSMIPNLLPVLALGGLAGFVLSPVDTDVILIAIMALGIGVDDTIHFLSRYRVARRRGLSTDEAVKETFSYAGRGILMTTLILMIGFAPLATSGYMTMRLLGTLLPVCLLVALAADLLLVPALIRLGWMDW